jgi:predicted dithiol-disulfide oxidoreductase (DUF899 family)
MTTTTIAHPPIASREAWLAQRIILQAHEKELTRHRDRVNAERRRLPMVKIEKEYVFDTPVGKQTLDALFEGRRQLIVYHFMFDPTWESGCPGRTSYANALGDLSNLYEHDTTFALISRAPLARLEAYKTQKGWVSRGILRLAAILERFPIRLNRTPGERSSSRTPGWKTLRSVRRCGSTGR